MATREDTYKSQLQELGIYQRAFDPEIKTLATLERELTRAKKEWAATAKAPAKPSVGHPLYAVVCTLRREILAHREALGLTPKALRRLRGVSSGPEEASQQDLLAQRLEQLAALTATYSGGREAVPESGTGADG